MLPASPQVTLEFIAERNAARLQELGVSPDRRTVEAALVQMIAALGELAPLSYRNTSSLSPFEKEEAALVLGRIAIALSTVGTCLGVDVGTAALKALGEKPMGPLADEGETNPADPTHPRQQQQQQLCRAAMSSTDVAQGASRQPTPPRSVAQQQQQQQQPRPRAVETTQQSLMLSPTSRDSFFTYLDRLAGDTRDAIEQADLRWVVPDENGRLEELMANGSAVHVGYDLFPLYYGMAQDRRQRLERHGQAILQPSHYTQPVSQNVAVAPTAAAEMPRYGTARGANTFSPTHFSNGLFSPKSDAAPADLFQANVRPPTTVLSGFDRGASSEGRYADDNVNMPSRPREPSAPQPVPPRAQSHPTQQAPAMYQPMSFEDFNTKVNYLRNGAVSGLQVAQLGLTFCYPQGDRVVELVPDGLQIMVTFKNSQEFLRLLDEARRSAHAPSAERIHRMDSIRRLRPMLAPPEGDSSGFSPSHFSHGLFAPYDTKSNFCVDYDAADRTLPPYLKLMAQQQQHQQHSSRPTGATAADDEDVVSTYMTAVRNADYSALESIVSEVRASAAALAVYGVTFCVPSTLDPRSTVDEKATGIHELFTGSSRRFVQPGERTLFLSFAQQYFPVGQ